MDIAEVLHTSSGYLLDGKETIGCSDAECLGGVEIRLERIEETRRMGVINAIESLLDATMR